MACTHALGLSRLRRPLPVQRQQAAQDVVIGHRGAVRPAVGRRHGGIQIRVRFLQPGRRGVVEVGERALGQLLLVAGLGDDAIRVGRALQAERRHLRHPVAPFRRVQPALAQVVEPLGGARDGLGMWADRLRQLGRDHRAVGQRLGALVRVAGVPRMILAHSGDSVTLSALLSGLAVGVAFEAFAGCDRTLATCQAKFGNAINFGGFPWIPAKNPFTGDAIV